MEIFGWVVFSTTLVHSDANSWSLGLDKIRRHGNPGTAQSHVSFCKLEDVKQKLKIKNSLNKTLDNNNNYNVCIMCLLRERIFRHVAKDIN